MTISENLNNFVFVLWKFSIHVGQILKDDCLIKT